MCVVVARVSPIDGSSAEVRFGFRKIQSGLWPESTSALYSQRIDLQQEISFLNVQVIVDRQGDDVTGDLRCDGGVMWASTCASSVDTLPVQMYQSTSKASRSAINANFANRGSLRIAPPAVARKDGVVSDAGVDCGGGAGGGVGGGSIELISAISLSRRFRYLAYVFCTSPIAWDRFTLDWLKR